MNPVGQQLVLSGIVPFRANIITCQSMVLSLWTNMVVQGTQLESRFCSSKDGWTPHSRGLDDKIFFVAFQRRGKAYQSTSLLYQSETLKDARSVSFLVFVCFLFFFVCPSQKGSHSPRQDFPQVARQLFSNFWYLEQLFNFVSSNVLLSKQFLSFSSNSQISEQFLELKLAFLKKEPYPPPWGRSWAQDACSRAAWSAVFKRKFKMADAACLR